MYVANPPICRKKSGGQRTANKGRRARASALNRPRFHHGGCRPICHTPRCGVDRSSYAYRSRCLPNSKNFALIKDTSTESPFVRLPNSTCPSAEMKPSEHWVLRCRSAVVLSRYSVRRPSTIVLGLSEENGAVGESGGEVAQLSRRALPNSTAYFKESSLPRHARRSGSLGGGGRQSSYREPRNRRRP